MTRLRFLPLCLLLASACGPGRQAGEKAAPARPEPTPDLFRVKLDTSRGDIVIEVHRDWAPRGADRFFELVSSRFYDGVRFHRVVRRFVVQWGINGDPAVSRLWSNLRILDDPVKQSNTTGMVSFAMRGPASRTTQVFINLADNKTLDKSGFAPFGRVAEGMDVVEKLWSAYGEVAPRGQGVDPSRIEMEGNAYLERYYPRLDFIKKATVIR